MSILPPAIRRVPPRQKDEANEWDTGREGRYIAAFILDDDADHVRYVVHLPWRDGDPTLSELEAEAREKLKERLTAIIAKI